MKKLMICLFALLLPLCASAEPLRAQLGAPEAFQATYYSNTGRSKVSVDAAVVVPDVVAVHRYEVAPRYFTTDEAELAANLYFGDGQWWHGDTEKTEVIFPELHGKWSTIRGCNLYAQGNVRRELSVTSRTVNRFGKTLFINNYFEIYNWDGGWSRQAGTAEEARRLADRLVNSVWPEMVYAGTDPRMQPTTDRIGSNIDGNHMKQYGYRLYYCRVVDGIPVTPVSNEVYRPNNAVEDAGYVPPMQYENVLVDVDADGIFFFRYENPFTIKGRLEENVPLLPFSQIMEIFSGVAPMSIASAERAESNLLSIDRIVLGYMCVPIKSDVTRYQMIPVWDFFGDRTVNGKSHVDEVMESWLTINAIDGTVIDREYGY